MDLTSCKLQAASLKAEIQQDGVDVPSLSISDGKMSELKRVNRAIKKKVNNCFISRQLDNISQEQIKKGGDGESSFPLIFPF